VIRDWLKSHAKTRGRKDTDSKFHHKETKSAKPGLEEELLFSKSLCCVHADLEIKPLAANLCAPCVFVVNLREFKYVLRL
jgi:hypothetical protein